MICFPSFFRAAAVPKIAKLSASVPPLVKIISCSFALISRAMSALASSTHFRILSRMNECLTGCRNCRRNGASFLRAHAHPSGKSRHDLNKSVPLSVHLWFKYRTYKLPARRPCSSQGLLTSCCPARLLQRRGCVSITPAWQALHPQALLPG